MTTEQRTLDTYDTGGALCVITTPRLHEAANETGITSIAFDDEALHQIAEHMKIIEPGEPLPPLMFLARHAGKAALGNPDMHWERGVAKEEEYYSAATLADGRSFRYDEVLSYSQQLDISRIHEIGIALEPGASHLEEVARSLTVAGRYIYTDSVGKFSRDSRGIFRRHLETLDRTIPDPIILEHASS